jgi:Amidase
MSAHELAGGIASGNLSSAEVVERFVARLHAVNGKLNAVTADLSESARKTAADIDKARARGEKLPPLAALPATIMEFDLAGTASTFELSRRRGETESRDDPYVAALRAAGAIPIAKTNVPELMIYTETDNPLYGRFNNPWDLERSCGGSGGEAAVICRRRIAAPPRQRHSRLASRSRSLLLNNLDPADRGDAGAWCIRSDRQCQRLFRRSRAGDARPPGEESDRPASRELVDRGSQT